MRVLIDDLQALKNFLSDLHPPASNAFKIFETKNMLDVSGKEVVSRGDILSPNEGRKAHPVGRQ